MPLTIVSWFNQLTQIYKSVSFFSVNSMLGSDLFKQCKEKGYLKKKDWKMDFKSAEIIIPEDSSDFIMSGEELVKLVDNKHDSIINFPEGRTQRSGRLNSGSFS